MLKKFLLISLFALFSSLGFAKEVSYSIDINSVEKKINGNNVSLFSLKNSLAVPIIKLDLGSITKEQNPVIKANLGDTLKVTFNNKTEEEITIHWHGVLLPNEMDGVSLLTQLPITPGESFTYVFEVKQTGTYWYHAHDLTEAQGVFGGIVFGDKNEDISNENVLLYSGVLPKNPAEVLADLTGRDINNMMHENHEVSDSQDSDEKDEGMNHKMVRNANMNHFSDVSYIANYINGSEAPLKIVDIKNGKVKLRIVNAYADGYLNFVYSGGKFTVIAADGINVKPLTVDHLRVAMGETYDIILEVKDKSKSYELVSFLLGGESYSKVIVGKGPLVPLESYNYNDYSLNQVYADLQSITPKFINFDKFKKVNNHEFSLVGDHMSYTWKIQENGADLSNMDLKVGDKVKVKITNNTMMPHPMHLHGHFFKVNLPKSSNNLIKHTINLDPRESLEFEFVVDAEGKWLYHCHNLFHMASGMMITLNVSK
ncbi:MAG: multicopper oxidase family protein [Alphaproteobacteria bacterium]|nr:multicopper oxidase family protein [Alphaproteobacteria bacterium]